MVEARGDQPSQQIINQCLPAADFAGCVQTLTRGLDPKRERDVDQGLRTWTRDNGQVIRLRTKNVVPVILKGRRGRYLQYSYGIKYDGGSANWRVQADCQDYTANWDQDGRGWFDVSNPERYLTPAESRNSHKYNSTSEAKDVLDEFCPQMDQLLEKYDAQEVREF